MVIKTNQLMTCTAKVAVSSEILTKHSTPSEYHVEFLNVKRGWYVEKPLRFKRLMILRSVQYGTQYVIFSLGSQFQAILLAADGRFIFSSVLMTVKLFFVF
jgi:hypothetical protein